MKKFALIALVLLIAVAPAFAATVKAVVKDIPYNHCPIDIYQAYATDPTGAYTQSGFITSSDQTISAVPGILALVPGDDTNNPNNVNAFPRFWANFAWPAAFDVDDWYVKSAQLIKYMPVVGQCSTYAPTGTDGAAIGAPYYAAKPAIVQSESYNVSSGIAGSSTPYGDIVGSKIRLWWPLMFEAPGTIFQLTLNTGTQNVTGQYTDTTNGWTNGTVPMTIHTDVWTWYVDANFESLEAAITLFHEVPFGTCEYPLIQDEKLLNHDLVVYNTFYNPPIIQDDPRYEYTLLCQVNAIECALNGINGVPDLAAARTLTVDFENNLWFACNPSTACDPTAEPTNQGSNLTLGIANTDCYPACCKLVIDTEYIADNTGIYGNPAIANVLDQYGRQFDPTTGYGTKVVAGRP
jgi:hypothetical protein